MEMTLDVNHETAAQCRRRATVAGFAFGDGE